MSANVLLGPASRKCEMCGGTGSVTLGVGCAVCAGSGEQPETCIRWGFGVDRCVKPYEHLGPCQDSASNTTTSLAAQMLSAAQAPSISTVSNLVTEHAEGIVRECRAALAQAALDRAKLRMRLEELIELATQAYDLAGNPFGNPEHFAIRAARKVLRETE